jgi:hypothetical protein
MKETDIPQEVIDHIMTYKPKKERFGAPMAILFALFIYYNYIQPDEN